MSKFKFVQWYGIVVCLLMAACTDVDITMPKGPKGDTGLSAYEFSGRKTGRKLRTFSSILKEMTGKTERVLLTSGRI